MEKGSEMEESMNDFAVRMLVGGLAVVCWIAVVLTLIVIVWGGLLVVMSRKFERQEEETNEIPQQL